MCKYDTLHINDNGYVVKCKGCGYFQVAFGTSIINLNDKEFSDFQCSVLQEINCSKMDGFPLRKSICIPTKCKEVALIFNANEIQLLSDLLVNASLMQQAIEALNGKSNV